MLHSAYKHSIDELKIYGVQSPEKDFEIFIKHSFSENEIKQLEILSADDIPTPHKDKIDLFFEKRKNRIPIDRIIHKSTFRNSDYILTSSVFKPGFETETMVDYALQYLEHTPTPHVLDCGTGTGCILLSLLNERADATGVGIDIDHNVIDTAQQNAENLKLTHRCDFILSDWSDGINDTFDLIISNPPRIPSDLIKDLVKEVALYDPHIALDGGQAGIEYYTRTAKLLHRIGKPNAVCIIQVGDIILKDAIKTIEREGFKNIKIGHDYKYSTNCLIFSNKDYSPTVPAWHKFLKFLGVKTN